MLEIQRERLRSKPWTAFLAPVVVIPLLAYRMQPHFPPNDADDWATVILLAGVVGVLIWAILRKLRADRDLASSDY
jgi:hypothetical protein